MKKLILRIVIGLCGLAIMLSVAASVQALPYTFTVKDNFIWDAPTTNVDDTPYTDQGGYYVYCKPVSQPEFTDLLKFYIADPAIMIVYLADYPCLGMPGQIDFAVTVVDTSGNESVFSNVVSVPLVPEVVPRGAPNFR